MPECGSQIILCNLPIRIDTYKGCAHGCKYCFTLRKYDNKNIRINERAKSVLNFIKGARSGKTSWCDWSIPLHWGGMSDPFQPCEVSMGESYKILKVLAETKYPFVVSTKSILPTTEKYFNVFKECNFVYQVSLVCPEYNKLEPGAPSFEERLKSLAVMSKIAKRVVVRIQPYIIEYHQSILDSIKKFKEVGAYGVVIEGIKLQKKLPGMIKLGNDCVYPIKLLLPKYLEIKEECKKNGLAFFCGENRLRNIGDSLTCCGCEGLEGWKVNKANLNSFLFDKENYKYTDKMKEKGTATVFSGIHQTSIMGDRFKHCSFEEAMKLCEKDKSKLATFLGERVNEKKKKV